MCIPIAVISDEFLLLSSRDNPFHYNVERVKRVETSAKRCQCHAHHMTVIALDPTTWVSLYATWSAFLRVRILSSSPNVLEGQNRRPSGMPIWLLYTSVARHPALM